MANKTIDWLTIETEYRGTHDSLRLMASRHEITEGAIRARAKKYGWTRDSAGLKRRLVSDKLQGITQDNTQCEIRGLIEQSAEHDARDMGTALEISRNCLRAMLAASATVTDAKECKVIMESTKLATDNIRKIRGLESDEGDGTVTFKLSRGDAGCL